jgi:hypothetical protein
MGRNETRRCAEPDFLSLCVMAATVEDYEHQVWYHLNACPLVHYLFETQKIAARVYLLRLANAFYQIKSSLVESHVWSSRHPTGCIVL